jgi:endoglucanase
MMKRFTLTGIGLVLALGLAGSVWADKAASLVFPLPAPGEAPAGSPVATHGKLSISNNKIVNKSGTAVQLKGMSFFWSNSGNGGMFYNEGTISWLAHDWKVDVLRVAMGAETDGTNKGYVDGAKATQETLARVAIEESIKRGLYVIIDFHSHKEHRSEATTFFKDMATSYGKYPNVLYEIWNEPLGDGNSNSVSGATIASYASAVGSAIRSTNGAEGIIIVGSPRWSSQPSSVNVSGVTNVAYSMHFYANEHGASYRNEMTSAAGSRAIFATEWGTTNADAKGNVNKGESDNWLSAMEQNKIGWANWAVTGKTKDNPDNTSILANDGKTGGGWTDNDLTESGKYVRGKFPKGNATYKVTVTQPANGGKIDVSKLKSSYGWGESLDLTAVPNAGWEIKTWKGNATGNTPELKGTFYALNLDISADFYECGVIKNGHFTYDPVGWVQVASGNAKANALSVSNSELAVDVTTAGADVWEVRVGNSSTTGMLAADHEYELKFKARSAAPRDIFVRLSSSNYVSIYGDTLKASLTATAQTFTHKFIVRRGATLQGGAVGFYGGDKAGKWYLSEVSLKDLGSKGTEIVSRHTPSAVHASWAIVKSSAGAQLRGPAEGGAEVSIYDTRGKLVRSMAAADGLNLSSGAVNAPAGNYLLVVRNSGGAEIYKSKFTMTR